jgi:hypothetical protein
MYRGQHPVAAPSPTQSHQSHMPFPLSTCLSVLQELSSYLLLILMALCQLPGGAVCGLQAGRGGLHRGYEVDMDPAVQCKYCLQ